ncbi:MAG TPA: hypothetical protein VFN94_00500 [Nitrospiria bacterium]|nr:hypothetical protein [Nitrospiria bacterium]
MLAFPVQRGYLEHPQNVTPAGAPQGIRTTIVLPHFGQPGDAVAPNFPSP